MREGRAPLVDGNLRSMFYQWVKPILSKLARELRQTKVDPYDEMSNALEYFIVELRLFRYSDLGLIDERWDGAGRRRYLFRVEPVLERRS
jgi:hypothetical protein